MSLVMQFRQQIRRLGDEELLTITTILETEINRRDINKELNKGDLPNVETN